MCRHSKENRKAWTYIPFDQHFASEVGVGVLCRHLPVNPGRTNFLLSICRDYIKVCYYDTFPAPLNTSEHQAVFMPRVDSPPINHLSVSLVCFTQGAMHSNDAMVPTVFGNRAIVHTPKRAQKGSGDAAAC